MPEDPSPRPSPSRPVFCGVSLEPPSFDPPTQTQPGPLAADHRCVVWETLRVVDPRLDTVIQLEITQDMLLPSPGSAECVFRGQRRTVVSRGRVDGVDTVVLAV